MGGRWDFLAPWCDTIKRLTYGNLEYEDDPHGTQKRILQATLPKRQFCADEDIFQTKFRKAREALALLSAVAHVDQSGWKYVLSKYCGVNLGNRGGEKFEEDVAARFLLVMDLAEKEGAYDSDLAQLVGVYRREEQSSEYLAALEKIAALDNRLKDGAPGVEVKIPVRVIFRAKQMFSAIGEQPVEDLLSAARAERVIKAKWEAYEQERGVMAVRPGSLRCSFVLEPIIAEFNNSPIRADTADAVATLLAANVWFSRLSLYLRIHSTLREDILLSKNVFGQMVSHVFDSTRRNRDLAATRYHSKIGQSNQLQIGTVVVYCDPSMTTAEFEALCSALVVTQTTKRLSMSLWLDPKDANSSAKRWKWLAYALFSKQARRHSALESVALNAIGSMSVADMAAFSAVLQAEHPEEELFDSPRCYINARDAMLKKGSIVHARPEYPDSSFVSENAMSVGSLTFPVRTFSDDNQSVWVSTIVPGHGKCLVQRDDLVFEEEYASEELQHGLMTLTIGFSNSNTPTFDGLPSCIATIGTRLKVLVLDLTCADLGLNFIVQCCPNLDELSLRSPEVDVRLRFGGYRALGQPLPELSDNWRDFGALTAELSDPSSPLTTCLRRLRVRLDSVRNSSGVQDETLIRTALAQLLHMLEVNQSLEYLDVIAPLQYHELLSQLRAYHHMPIDSCIPLPTSAKAAFLSALSPSRTPNQVGPSRSTLYGYEFDQHVVSKILQFAVSPVLRGVYFHDFDWGDRYDEIPL